MNISIDIKQANVEAIKACRTEDKLLAYIESLTDGLKEHVENTFDFVENRPKTVIGIRVKFSDVDEGWGENFKECFCTRFQKPIPWSRKYWDHNEESALYWAERFNALQHLGYFLAKPRES